MKKILMKRLLLTAALILSAQIAFTDARAEDPMLPVTPGMYTITSKTSSNVSPEPKTKIADMCIDKDLLDPSDYLPSAAQCSLDNVKKDGNKASFDIKCKSGESTKGKPGMPEMNGKGDCSTTETEIYCRFEMVGSVQGREFTIKAVREGKRSGECPEL